MTAYEPVIGLEVHVQLATASKLFCGCPTTFGAAPNSQTCPVCLGLPGTLPVLNQRAFELGIRTAVALECRVAEVMKFDRKQYFYPDLPKGYQISQYDRPLAHDGHLDVAGGEAVKRIRIRRAHLEEDAGKLLHDPNEPFSYVDFNRAGIPLLEIVTEPDLRLPEDAYAYLVELKAILRALGVSNCNMEEGSLRCDANVSLRPSGAAELGAKVEIKNLNSFKAVKDALAFEMDRQRRVLERGEAVAQETRLWNARAQTTEPMRSKEEASDYRYFPEPDLVPFHIEAAAVERARRELPELPARHRQRLVEAYGLSAYDAGVLAQFRPLGALFEQTVAHYPKPKPVVNWIMGDLLGYLNGRSQDPETLVFQPAWLVHLLEAIERGEISGKTAKALFVEALERQRDPQELMQGRDVRQIVDAGELERLVDVVVSEHQKSVADYQKGKANALMFLVGKCMERSQGKANPQQLKSILQRKLAEPREAVS
ncbi:MAG: Asp-tRNA(Asn)/Glu-tRNA(Gln) amidotransferase subunit GatB [Candidatus Omnitrophica bacterium]|nr:Asp-tRNA(Asn)/Glu-tRNA(Gln) amidotransferase subunit GatB [Candidatus Omnitrophota bacterium]